MPVVMTNISTELFNQKIHGLKRVARTLINDLAKENLELSDFCLALSDVAIEADPECAAQIDDAFDQLRNALIQSGL